ncbi:SDR family NAD(P)-dependent oxidoreductase [Myxococcaceae bacterium GXIMD 01537]
MRPPIDGATILITGAASILGREIACQLARRARTLVLVSRRVDQLVALRGELKTINPTLGLLVRPCDVSRPAEVDALIGELERNLVQVDVLVNNARHGEDGLFEQAHWPRVAEVLQANVVAPALLTHRLLAPMIERGRGGILNIGSGAEQLFLPGEAAYAATQHFLEGFTESLRLEVEGTGVVVTRVAPGPVMCTRPEQDAADEAPLPWFTISARRCAREALYGFARGEALVYPGLGHRWVMRLMHMLPRAWKRGLGRWVGRGLRETSLIGPRHPDTQLHRRVLLAGEPVPG